MSIKIKSTNGFRAVAALRRAAADPRVEEVEGEGMDEGRVFIHLVPGYWFGRMYGTHCMSCGSREELRDVMRRIEPEVA